MTRKRFSMSWGTVGSDEPDHGSTTPHQFMVEYWKLYEEYMQRKEHLVEVAITAYSALAVLVLTRSDQTWQHHGFGLVVFGVATSLIVEQFIYAELGHWQSAVKFSIASQTKAADWLSRAAVAAELVPVRDASGVRIPQGLAAELMTMSSPVVPTGFFRWVHIACHGGPFAQIAYRALGLWWLAFLVRAWWTASPEWWGLSDFWSQVLLLLRRV